MLHGSRPVYAKESPETVGVVLAGKRGRLMGKSNLEGRKVGQ